MLRKPYRIEVFYRAKYRKQLDEKNKEVAISTATFLHNKWTGFNDCRVRHRETNEVIWSSKKES